MNKGNILSFDRFHFDSLDSTNIRAHELIKKGELKSPSIISASYQEKGKGQRDNVWVSERDKNLLFSIVCETGLSAEFLFGLNQVGSLAILDWLDKLAVEQAIIKWPNDLLIGQKKIGGILIENSLRGNQISQSIFGMGINVNQIEFPAFQREATSLRIQTQTAYVLDELLASLLNDFSFRFSMLKEDTRKVEQDYLNRLYGLNRELNFRDQKGEFTGMIRGVDAHGQLVIEKDGQLQSYGQKEIVFLD